MSITLVCGVVCDVVCGVGLVMIKGFGVRRREERVGSGWEV